MCKFVVLLDNDKAGIEAFEKARDHGVIDESQVRFTICNGSPEAELEDCLKTCVYADAIKNEFGINILVKNFRGNEKWSKRAKRTFLSQGLRWTEALEKKVKHVVANSIPLNIKDIDEVIITEKTGFLNGLVSIIEDMLKE